MKRFEIGGAPRAFGNRLGVAAMLSIVVLAIPATATAKEWWENTPFDRGTWHFPSPPAQTPSHFGDPVSGHVVLVNRTNIALSYALNGQRKPRLAPGASIRWNLDGDTEHPPTFDIAFDNGHNHQLKYRLTRDSTNIFSINPNGIDLRRMEPDAQPPRVRIDDQGRTYLNGSYLGRATRVRFQNGGATGWAFKIPNGWEITRRDGETTARARR